MISPNKKVMLIILCMASSFTLILLLQLDSRNRINKKGQNFLRTFIPATTKPSLFIDLGNSNYYFAGVTSKNIYLGNYQIKNQVICFNADLKDRINYHYIFPKTVSYHSDNQKIQVDSDDLYILEKESRYIFRGDFNKATNLKTFSRLPDYIFDGLIVNNDIIIKNFDSTSRQNIISKYDSSGNLIKLSRRILQKQIDGIISTDGIFCYEPIRRLFYYTYFYRDQFICFDTNLQVKYQATTIDTNSYAKISLQYLKSANYTTFNAPPPFVNKTSCVNVSWNFIQSTMIAKNDIPEKLEENSVIDVYYAQDGRYRGSFYLPHLKGEKLRSMQVFSNRLATLQGNYLSVYTLPGF